MQSYAVFRQDIKTMGLKYIPLHIQKCLHTSPNILHMLFLTVGDTISTSTQDIDFIKQIIGCSAVMEASISKLRTVNIEHIQWLFEYKNAY